MKKLLFSSIAAAWCCFILTAPAEAQNPNPKEALERLNKMREDSRARTFHSKGSADTERRQAGGAASVAPTRPDPKPEPTAVVEAPANEPAVKKSKVSYRDYAPETQLNYLIHFDFDSAYLTAGGRSVLDEFCNRVLVPDLANHPDSSYIIAGHTDQSGPVEYNRLLSERRAKATKAYLVENCAVPTIDLSERLEAVGLGEEKPLAGVPSSQQRRVEFQVNI